MWRWLSLCTLIAVGCAKNFKLGAVLSVLNGCASLSVRPAQEQVDLAVNGYF